MISLVVHRMSRSACICLFRIVTIKLTMLLDLYFAFITVVLLIRERDYFPSWCGVWLPSTWQLRSQQPTSSLLPASWSYCQWCHGCELSTFDGSNDPCHFAAVDFVFIAQQKPLVTWNKAEILKYSRTLHELFLQSCSCCRLKVKLYMTLKKVFL